MTTQQAQAWPNRQNPDRTFRLDPPFDKRHEPVIAASQYVKTGLIILTGLPKSQKVLDRFDTLVRALGHPPAFAFNKVISEHRWVERAPGIDIPRTKCWVLGTSMLGFDEEGNLSTHIRRAIRPMPTGKHAARYKAYVDRINKKWAKSKKMEAAITGRKTSLRVGTMIHRILAREVASRKPGEVSALYIPRSSHLIPHLGFGRDCRVFHLK